MPEIQLSYSYAQLQDTFVVLSGAPQKLQMVDKRSRDFRYHFFDTDSQLRLVFINRKLKTTIYANSPVFSNGLITMDILSQLGDPFEELPYQIEIDVINNASIPQPLSLNQLTDVNCFRS